MAIHVELRNEGQLVQTISVERPVRLGRDARRCDVLLDAPGVSGVHVELAPTPEGLRLRDLDSKNGVLVDGVLRADAVIGPGEQATLGVATLVVLPAAPIGPWPWAARRLGPLTRGPVQRRLEALVAAVHEATGAPEVWAVRWRGERLEHLATRGDGDGLPAPGTVSRSIVGQVARSRRAWWADDAAGDGRWSSVHSVAALRSVGCVPLGRRGAVFLSDPRGPGRFAAEARERVEALCAMASEAIALGADPAVPAVDGAVGTGPAMEELLAKLQAFAPFPYSVLLLGERGTGKTHLAEALHRMSGRPGAFVHANASAITETLAEDVIFGHDKGAFAGADRGKKGWVEQAEGGTLFLDEIGDLPASVQPKLLVLLDRGTFQRVGGDETLTFTGRIVAATNRRIDETGLRRDLYDRLSTVTLQVPPLREHPQDIPDLAQSLWARELDRLGLAKGPPISNDALEILAGRRYPNRNIRGLANDLQHALVQAIHEGAQRIERHHLPQPVAAPPLAPSVSARDHATAMHDFERQLLESVLAAHGGNQTDARKALGLSHGAWYRAKRRVGL